MLYRVAQEGLTNTARHAAATEVDLRLRRLADGTVGLLVKDNGRGIGTAPDGAGLSGMRERALLIGAELTVREGAEGGTEVHLNTRRGRRAPERTTPVGPRETS